MFYQEFAPPPKLAPFVRSVWMMEIDSPLHLKDHVFPDGYTELIVHYGLLPETEKVAAGHEPTIFAGQIRQAFQLEFSPGNGMIGARFHAEGAHCLLRENLSATTDNILTVAEWSPQLTRELEERIWLQPSRQARVQTMWEFLEEKISYVSFDPVIARLTGFIRRMKGQLEISALMGEINLGQRQVERRFKAAVGLSMKEYNRIIRFKEAARLLEHEADMSFADIAVHAGYYDQAHFNREFKTLAGTSPGNYVRNPGALGNLYLEHRKVENIQYES